MITYEIPGNPIPLKRHRHGGKRCYDPQKKQKEAFANYLKILMKGLFEAYVPIKLSVEYHMPIPKSYSKKKALECVSRVHCKRPDLSNLIKFTEDALNKIVWADDCLIGEIAASKFYSETPKTVFKIESIAEKRFEKNNEIPL